MLRAQVRDRTGKPVDRLRLSEGPDGNFVGEMHIGPVVYDVKVTVSGREMTWDAMVRRAEAPPPITTRSSGPPSGTRKLAEKMYAAAIKGDFATTVDLTWAGIVEEAGGREHMIDMLRESMKELEKRDIKIVSVRVGEPGELVTEGAYTFAALPTQNEMTVPAGRLIGESFVLAISADGGKTWGFVEGAGLAEPADRDRFTPKIPASLRIPPHKKPILVRE
jgi:hypothetical protein